MNFVRQSLTFQRDYLNRQAAAAQDQADEIEMDLIADELAITHPRADSLAVTVYDGQVDVVLQRTTDGVVEYVGGQTHFPSARTDVIKRISLLSRREDGPFAKAIMRSRGSSGGLPIADMKTQRRGFVLERGAAGSPGGFIPLADRPAEETVNIAHPEIQAGAIRDNVTGDDGTWFSRRRPGVYPAEAYQTRIQANRPISDHEVQQMAQVIGYAWAAEVRGEQLEGPVRDSPYSFVLLTDSTKSRSDDVDAAMERFENALPGMMQSGSPVRKTDRTGAKGTQLVEGLHDPELKFETYYDSVSGPDRASGW